MADQFKKYMHKISGLGGIYCDCCNKYSKYSGKEKYILNKLARNKLKSELKEQVKSDLNFDDCEE